MSNYTSVACVSKDQRVDETLRSLRIPDCQQEAINLLSNIALNLPGTIFQVLQRQDGSFFVIYISCNCQDLCELEPKVLQSDFQELYKLIHPQDLPSLVESIAISKTTFSPWLWEGRIITPSGIKWLKGTSQPERQANGDFLWNGLVMNITDQKRTEEKLQESEARYQAILDAIPDLMFRISRDGKYLDLKTEGANVTFSREEVVGKSMWEILPIDVAAIGQEAIAKTLDSGTLQTCEYQLPTPLGLRDYEARLVVSGEDEILAIVRDITERKQAEVTLHNLAQKFSKAFSCSPNSITISTLQEGRFIEVNDGFVELSGYEPEQAIGKTAFELNIWVNQSDRHKLLQSLQAQGVVRNLEMEFRQKSGEIIIALVSAEVIDLDGISCILSVHHDITERKQVEAKLRLSAQRDRLLAQTLSRIRSSLQLDQILQTTVTEVRQFLQVDRVFIGLDNANLGPRTLAESVDPNYPSISGWSTNDETYLQELKNSLKKHRERVVEDITKITLSPKVRAHFQKFQIRATLAVPIMLGEDLFGALIANQCSGPRNWQPIEIDLLQQMSEQVAIAIQQSMIYQELAQLNTNLEHQVQERTAQLQQKIQEVEELHRLKDVVLHTIAHELRTSVMGNLMVLQNLVNQGVASRDAGTRGLGTGDWGLGTGDAGTRGRGDMEESTTLSPSSPSSPIPVPNSIVERMIQGNDRQLTMINSLLEINSCEKDGLAINSQLVQYGTLLKETITGLQPILLQNQATLNDLIPEDLPLIMVDATRLKKVMVSFLTHSLQHNPPGLNFTVTANVEAGMIRTQIQDNGIAMSNSECDRLFDLYVRDPQDRCSTSIGLKMYLCRQIIKAHGGEIGVTTNPKQGLTFWFTLPLPGLST
ncbi:MAG: PAS domain S-box protein [Desmonostoc vinosum HA7617-LM4]|nr:PAS domain S-box protein [Desmonostoc vinosum HA7617-LM4]